MITTKLERPFERQIGQDHQDIDQQLSIVLSPRRYMPLELLRKHTGKLVICYFANINPDLRLMLFKLSYTQSSTR